MQTVSELVEQRRHLAMGQQRRLLGAGRREIAGEEGDRQLHPAATVDTARTATVHPRAAALAGTCVEVEITARNGGAIALQIEHLNIGMPGGDVGIRHEAHGKQFFDHREEAVDDLLRREIRSQLLLRRSEEHTSELQSRENLVCRLLLEKKNEKT